jgi:large subunit ribosomal protein L5
VSVALTRPGYRIAKKRERKSVGQKHRITKEESIDFFKQSFGAQIG